LIAAAYVILEWLFIVCLVAARVAHLMNFAAIIQKTARKNPMQVELTIKIDIPDINEGAEYLEIRQILFDGILSRLESAYLVESMQTWTKDFPTPEAARSAGENYKSWALAMRAAKWDFKKL
jgi:hypothetical protein